MTVWHITFTAFGARLHGDDRPTVDREHNLYGTPFLEPDPARHRIEHQLMSAPAVILSLEKRLLIEDAIPRIRERWSWDFIVCAAATDHIHSLIAIEQRFHGKQARALLKRELTTALDERWAATKRQDGMSWWCEGGSTKAVKDGDYFGNAFWYIWRQRATR